MSRYRSWRERRLILRAIVADTDGPPLASFGLSPAEEHAWRLSAQAMLERNARRTSPLKHSYRLPVARPFRNIVYAALGMIVVIALAIAVIEHHAAATADETPLLTAGGAAMVAVSGWVVAGWLSHRNTVRQNTSNLLFARFSQANFTDAIHRFHFRFGFDVGDPVTPAIIEQLRATPDEENWRLAASVTYLLNYFEFVAHGVLKGDLDPEIVRDNFRGIISFYHDKCRPIVRHHNQRNAKTYASLIALRLHYDEP